MTENFPLLSKQWAAEEAALAQRAAEQAETEQRAAQAAQGAVQAAHLASGNQKVENMAADYRQIEALKADLLPKLAELNRLAAKIRTAEETANAEFVQSDPWRFRELSLAAHQRAGIPVSTLAGLNASPEATAIKLLLTGQVVNGGVQTGKGILFVR
jgi:hypothetical protein